MNNRNYPSIRLFLLGLVLLLGTVGLVSAQGGNPTVTVTQVDTSHFPEINVWVSAVDAQGNPVTRLGASDFVLLENGQPVTVTDVFQARDQQEAGAINTILTIDRSGSMDQVGKMEAAKAAVLAFIDRMRPEDNTGIVAFGTQVEVVQSLTNDKDALRAAVTNIQAIGDTTMYDGIMAAMDILATVEGRRAIILLSDGIDTHSRYAASDVLGRTASSELSIYAIGLGDPSLGNNSRGGIDEAELQRIAEESRGTYTFTPDPATLSNLYSQLSAQLQNEYRLTYTTSNTLRDGIGRGLTVNIANLGGVEAIYNPGGLIPETVQTQSWTLFIILLVVLVGLLALPQMLRTPGAAPFGGKMLKRNSRVKLTNGAKQAKSAGKSRVRMSDKQRST